MFALAEIAGERYAKLAELYSEHFLEAKPYPAWALSDWQVWWPLADNV